MARSLVDVISPVLRSKGYMVKTPEVDITWQNQYMLVETDQGEALHSNGILTQSYTTSFCICRSVLHLPSKWCRWILTITELAQSWYLPATLAQRFDSYNIEDLPFLEKSPVNILFFDGYKFWGRKGVNSLDKTVLRNLINYEK